MAKFKNQDLLLDDNEQILMGDDDDASIYWDGSDLLINQLLKHTSQGYYATKAYVEQVVAGLEWQDSVLSATTDIPIGPTYGDRYIIPSGASGAWSGYDDYIATYKLTWDLVAPSAGFAAWVEDEGLYRVWSGSEWVRFGGVIDHGALLGLADDDHSQYLLADGTRVLTGDWDIGDGRKLIADAIWARDGTGMTIGDSDASSYLLVTNAGPTFGGGGALRTYMPSYVYGGEGDAGQLYIVADQGDDNPDFWGILSETDGRLSIKNKATGSWLEHITFYNTGSMSVSSDIDIGGNATVTGYVSASAFYGDGSGLTGSDHGSLTGLSDDDHTIYYHTDGRRPWSGTLTVESTGSRLEFLEDSALIGVPSNADLLTLTPTALTVDGDVYADNLTITGILSGADHGGLEGLADDDHTQYHNDTRGDARYYTQSVLNAGQLDTRYYTETEVDTALLDYVLVDGSRAMFTLSVTGDVDIQRHMAIGNNADIDIPGFPTYERTVNINEISTSDIVNTYGLNTSIGGTADNATAQVVGHRVIAYQSGTGNQANLIRGVGITSYTSATSADVDNIEGLYAKAYIAQDYGVADTMIGGSFDVSAVFSMVGASSTDIMGVKATVLSTGSGDYGVTNSHCIKLVKPGATFNGSFTNLYGIYIEDMSSTSISFDNDYNIYSDGANSTNYFEGKILSGDILPNTSDTYDIGHSDAVWDNIWCKTLHTSAGSVHIGSVELTDVGGVLTTTGSISAAGGATPASHNNDYHSEAYITTSSVTYETLNANSDVGTGSTQVAQGDHTHGVADGVWILLDKTTCSNSASAGAINLTGYSKIMLIWENLIPATDAQDLNLVVSDDNGATWESANYYGYTGGATDVGGAFSENMTGDSLWHITDPGYGVGSDPGEDGANGWLLFYGFNSAKKTYANGQMTWWDSGGYLYNMWGGFMYNVSTALNGLKITYSSGNIESGTVTIYGIADS